MAFFFGQLYSELLREGNWRCEGPLDEGNWRCEGPMDEGNWPCEGELLREGNNVARVLWTKVASNEGNNVAKIQMV